MMIHFKYFALNTCLLIGLVACSKPDATLNAANQPARSVQSIRLNGLDTEQSTLTFTAEVRPKIESRLGFRVGGKITQRLVELGQTVQPGQALFKLDATDLNLAVQASTAQINAAKANNDLAQAALTRAYALSKQGFISQASVDTAQAQAKAAQANLNAIQASGTVQNNAANYTSLLANTAGVITGIDAEVGQVVSAGMPVIRIANTAKEVVFSVPEHQLSLVKALRGQSITVNFWSNQPAVNAVIRDIAAIADPNNRSFLVKAQLPAAIDIPLGSTATVKLPNQAVKQMVDAQLLPIPLSAIVEVDGKPQVWTVEQNKVYLKPIKLETALSSSSLQANTVMASGLKTGTEIVTAGTHTLVAGQAVQSLLPNPTPTLP